jgi:hypothetical protein
LTSLIFVAIGIFRSKVIERSQQPKILILNPKPRFSDGTSPCF